MTLATALLVLCVALTSVPVHGLERKYIPDWDSLDSRPLPGWYDDAKIGIFIHFGVYSVPSFVSEWFWCYWQCPERVRPDVLKFMSENYRPGFTYQDFAKDFTLEFFNATEWINLFESSGARYAVLTSKHHEGFTMWPSKYSFSWNSMDVGPRRDVVGEFSEAVRKSGRMHLGLYHSLFEWFNPLFHEDSDRNFTTRYYAASKALPELYELVNTYKPDLIWSDGDAGPVDYWQSKEFLAWLYNESPVKDSVVVNDRWGEGTSCLHGGFLNCADRYDPSENQTRKWENAMTLDTYSWGYRRNGKLEEYLSIKALLTLLARTISNGGNLLVDVGPTKEGTIPVIMQERLLQMGSWLSTNGEAIYATKPWPVAWNDSVTPDVYYTSAKDGAKVYAIFLDWPADEELVLGSFNDQRLSSVVLVGQDKNLHWKKQGEGIVIELPRMSTVQHLQNAWVVKLAVNMNELERTWPAIDKIK